MVKQIPNIITSLNLLCGTIAIMLAVSGNLVAAAIFTFLGIFFDFFDGLAARALNAQSQVGLEMDSLADVVTSGVVPGIVMVQLLNEAIFGVSLDITTFFEAGSWNNGILKYIPFIGLLIVVASAYRLAKFNVDTRQTSSFIGLPTPANTLLILSLPLILTFHDVAVLESIILNKWVLICLTLLSCFLLNAEIPLFALKFKTWDFKSNAVRYIFLLCCLVAIILFHFIAIPIILALYIVISIIWKQ